MKTTPTKISPPRRFAPSPIRRFAASPLHPRRRGTVILLVVAVLALLAVIGTVYIVSSRTEKANAQSMEAAYNLQLARDAIMQQTVQVIGNSLLDSTGAIAGYNTTGTGGAISHNYDYPDASEPWLAATLHLQTAPSSSASCSQLTSSVFDPATGQYDLAPTTTVNVVGDQTANATDPYSATNPDGMPTAALVADAYYNLLPFSDASGIRYRYGIRIIDTNRMANLNTGAVDDSGLGDTFGIWLDSMRLAPAAGVLPTGSIDYFNQADNLNSYTAYLQQYTTANGLGRAGYSTGNATFSLANWQHQLLRFEKPDDSAIAPFDLADELELRSYGEYGTPYHLRFAVADSPSQGEVVWPNTLSANPTNPTSSSVTGNPGRRGYTTCSWSEDLRSYTDPATKYTLNGGSPPSTVVGGVIWPVSPARVAANIPSSVTYSAADGIFDTAMAASNIATVMEFCTGHTNSDGTTNSNFPDSSSSFTHEEACAFAANYCTAKWNGFTLDPNAGNKGYFLPAGPSFVDNTGICFRSTTSASTDFGNGSTDLHSENATKVYLGYSAQPFFSEVVAHELEDTSAAPRTLVSGTAIELYNPYPVPLSLNDYEIKSGDGSQIITFSGQYIPANGYFVVANGTIDSTIPPSAQSMSPSTLLKANDSTGTDFKYILYRKYYPRPFSTTNVAIAPVDQIDYTSLTSVAGSALPQASLGQPAKDFSIARPGGPTTGQWSPTINPTTGLVRGAAGLTTLGTDNGGSGSGYPLPDRYAPTTIDPTTNAVISTPSQGAPFGLGEFGRIMRIANEFDTSTPTGIITPSTTNGGTIPDHLAQLATTAAVAPYKTMVMTTSGTDSTGAQILFDFYADPSYYSSVPPSDNLTNAGLHDIRAVRLLSQIAVIDRVSDYNIIIDPTAGANDINKIRLPGRINVNTACGDVLRAIPNMTNQMVANIIAYRGRQAANTVSYGAGSTEGSKTCAVDFSDTTKYPGTGIRSLAELLVPLAAASTTTASATTIDQRDVLWGRICNLCTVRSDTFVVYGYLEAVRQNPNYTGSFDNKFMWYTSPTDAAYSSTLTIDNPHNTGPLVRVGRRRFLAIVDRSFCNQNKLLANGSANTKFLLPKIVAIKDLPDVPNAEASAAN